MPRPPAGVGVRRSGRRACARPPRRSRARRSRSIALVGGHRRLQYKRAAGPFDPRSRQAVRANRRALRRRPLRGGGRARRPARAERRRQVHAREDRRRPGAADRRRGARLRRAGRLSRRAGEPRLPSGALPVPRLVHGRRAAAPAPAARELVRRRGGAAGAAGAGRALGRGRSQDRGDVQGHDAAPWDRAGARRQPARLAPRRADQRARPGRADHRAAAARGAARARRGGAPQLPPAERDRAGLRPRGDHQPRQGRRRRNAARALACPRRRDRDGRGREDTTPTRPAPMRRASSPSSSPPGSRSTASASSRPRSRRATSRRSGTARERHSDRDRLRPAREPAPARVRDRPHPHGGVPRPVCARHRARVQRGRPVRRGPDGRRPRRASAGRSDAPRPGDVRDAVPWSRPGDLPDALGRARRRRARAAPAARRAAARPQCAAHRPLRRRGGRVLRLRLRRLRGHRGDHVLGRRLVARPLLASRDRARPGGGRRGRDLAARLGLPLGDRERHRRLHALRRRPRRRAARPDRRGDQLRDADRRREQDVLGASVRGALPGRPARDQLRELRPHAGGPPARPVRRRAGRRRLAVAVDACLSRPGRGGRERRLRAPGLSSPSSSRRRPRTSRRSCGRRRRPAGSSR